MRSDALSTLGELIRLKICDLDSGQSIVPHNLLPAISAKTGITPAMVSAKAKLTLGLPDGLSLGGRRFARHLFWWPAGVPTEDGVGIVSSRLSRELERWEPWFLGLRASCAGIDPRRERLVVATDSTTGRFAARAAELFGKPILQLRAATGGSVHSWWRSTAHCEGRSASGRDLCVYVSPPILADDGDPPPLRDALVVELSRRLTALFVRPGGNIAGLIRARLQHPDHRMASVRLLLGPQLTSSAVRDELMQNGCVGWNVVESTWAAAIVRSATPPVGQASQLRLADETQGEWLTHCTRRCPGPWPRQPDEEYLDELILSAPTANRSALATLNQIVQDRCLIGASAGVRGATPVVCFTAVPLAELHRLRVFRPHRGRWDFQPYGICLRREWLRDRGARPVHYASEAAWQQMSEDEQPFFQIEESLTKAGRAIDWTVENEWRVVGDVRLDTVPVDAAFLFVPTWEEARQLAAISPWPVRVLHDTPRVKSEESPTDDVSSS